MAWNKMTSYQKTKDRRNLNQGSGEDWKAMPDDIEEETRKKCDAMLLSAQKEAGDVRQQALRAAEATREDAKKDAAEIRQNALEVCQQAKAEAKALVAAAEEQAQDIQRETQKERKAVLRHLEKEAQETRFRAQAEAEAIRGKAVQAARIICQSTLKEAREIYLDLQSEMNQMIDGINQAQNSFMKSYKEVHRILDTIPGKLIQLDGEEDELGEDQEVPVGQDLLRHMEELLGEDGVSGRDV